jgi:hypothetical protein
MLPEEWPIAAPAADQNAPARRAGSGRLATVRVDFFLDAAQRLTEQERALMTAMLHCLVGDIADELRAGLPNGWAAANDETNLSVIDALTAARLLDERQLMALLLRRADEERIAAAARARSGRREARVLQGLVSDEHGGVAGAAMALIIARGRRRDRFGQCLVDFDDLPFESAEILVNSIAAALRRDLAGVHSVTAADRELALAAGRLLARHDPDRGVDALTAMLVDLLEDDGRLGDDLIMSAAEEGEVAFLAMTLARRAGVAPGRTLDELLSGDEERVMVLFRMAGVSRQLTARLLAGIGDLLGLADPGHAIGVFDRMSEGHLEAARTWLTADRAYRSALEALGMGHGQRTV